MSLKTTRYYKRVPGNSGAFVFSVGTVQRGVGVSGSQRVLVELGRYSIRATRTRSSAEVKQCRVSMLLIASQFVSLVSPRLASFGAGTRIPYVRWSTYAKVVTCRTKDVRNTSGAQGSHPTPQDLGVSQRRVETQPARNGSSDPMPALPRFP